MENCDRRCKHCRVVLTSPDREERGKIRKFYCVVAKEDVGLEGPFSGLTSSSPENQLCRHPNKKEIDFGHTDALFP